MLKLKHGMRVTCTIEGRPIKMAKISINRETREVWICQNIINGNEAPDKLGFIYSWSVFDDRYNLIEEGLKNNSVTNFKIIDNDTTIMPNKEHFKLGADPEFTITFNGLKLSASEVLNARRDVIQKSGCVSTDMGYKIASDTSNEFGHDGASSTGELRPAPEEDPIKLAKNIKQIVHKMYKVFPEYQLTTKSIAAPIGGHIHIDLIDETEASMNKLKKYISAMFLPLLMGEDMLSNKVRSQGSSYGQLSDFRTMNHPDATSLEFRAPSAEWITTEKVATGTLCYFKTILHEIYNNEKKFKKNNVLLFKSWEQGTTLQKLAITQTPAIMAFIIKETIKAVKKCELYPKYKKEIDFILSPKKVMAEKNKHNYDMFSGWGCANKSKVVKLETWLEETGPVNEGILGLARPRYASDDENVELFANEIAKRVITHRMVPDKNLYIFGLKRQEDESNAMPVLITIDNNGTRKIRISKNILQNEEMLANDVERLSIIANRLGDKLSMSSDRKLTLLGIPYSMRINNVDKSVKDVLKLTYEWLTGKLETVDFDSITVSESCTPIMTGDARTESISATTINQPDDSEVNEIEAFDLAVS